MNSLTSPVSIVSGNNTITHTLNGQPAVSSKDIALRFQKKHKDILRDIERIRLTVPKAFHGRNFAPMITEVEIGKGATRQDPAFLLTRDAFSLLAMGFTGKAAILWKLKYIEAFNALERAALENLSGQVIEARRRISEVEAGAEQARRAARAEGARIAYRLTPARRRRMHRAVYWRNRGLGIQSVAKLLDMHGREAASLLKAAALIGLTEQGAA
ncbi:MAG: Rha family transcriptional regulator [Desulfovibrio sp.]|nr:Rha family transcriptional regulator [Desulfovibrio sp.]